MALKPPATNGSACLRGDAKDKLSSAGLNPGISRGTEKAHRRSRPQVEYVRAPHPNELPIDDQVKQMRKQVDNARFLGAEFGLTFGVDGPQYFDNYFKLMRETAPYAQEKGLKLVLKPHGGASGAADEIMRCLKEVGHPNFKIWFDAGNIIYYTGKIRSNNSNRSCST